jgi:hypothetical protein
MVGGVLQRKHVDQRGDSAVGRGNDRVCRRGGEGEVALTPQVGERAVLLALVGGELLDVGEVAADGVGEV